MGFLQLFKNLNISDCALIGGEPTLYPDLNKLLEYGSAHGMSMGVVTNGRRLADRRYCASLLHTDVSRISISLEGSTPQVHDGITQRPGSFHETLAGIKNVLNAGFSVDVITTICRANAHDLQRIQELLRRLGLKHAVFNLCTPSIDASQPLDEVLLPTEMARTLSSFLQHEVPGLAISIVTPFPPCMIPDTAGDQRYFGVCQMFHGDGVTIDVDGAVIPCTHFSGMKLFDALDNNGIVIEADRFYQLWDSVGKQFRDRLWVYPAEKCEACDDWQRCYGGCPLFWTCFDPTAVLSS